MTGADERMKRRILSEIRAAYESTLGARILVTRRRRSDEKITRGSIFGTWSQIASTLTREPPRIREEAAAITPL